MEICIFPVGAHKNDINIFIHIFGKRSPLFIPGVELLSHRVDICLTLVDVADQFSKLVIPIYTPTLSVWEV